MPEYIFKGTMDMSGVDFFITADNEEDARSKAKAGKYDDYDVGGASGENWHINLDTLGLNE